MIQVLSDTRSVSAYLQSDVLDLDEKESLRKELQTLVPAEISSVTFRLDSSATADQVEKLAREITQRVCNALGRQPARIKLYPNLASFLVEGDPEMLMQIADQTGVKGGFVMDGSTRKQQPGLIKPVRKYAPNKESWARRSSTGKNQKAPRAKRKS